jgi:membrane fusion protein (multidrug efflux system)
MKRRAIVIAWLLGIAPALLFTACGDSEAQPGTEQQKSQEQITSVKVRSVKTEPFAETLSLTGYVQALDDIIVSTEEGGVLKEWKVSKGRRVRKGQVLVLMNDDVLKPMYEAAHAQYLTSQLNYEKQKKVYSEQAISELQFKTAEYTRDAAKAQADLALARLERSRIKSPVTGILDDRLMDRGELAPPGAPVARVVSIDRVKILIYVPERYAGTVERGAEVSFTVTSFPGETFAGKVSYVGAAVMIDNRSFPVELVVSNPGRILKPEMIAKATILQTAPRDAILLEDNVVQEMDQGKYVVYVEDNGTARERTVTLGRRNRSMVEITSGLNEGDRVIVVGQRNVFDGQSVTVEQES